MQEGFKSSGCDLVKFLSQRAFLERRATPLKTVIPFIVEKTLDSGFMFTLESMAQTLDAQPPGQIGDELVRGLSQYEWGKVLEGYLAVHPVEGEYSKFKPPMELEGVESFNDSLYKTAFGPEMNRAGTVLALLAAQSNFGLLGEKYMKTFVEDFFQLTAEEVGWKMNSLSFITRMSNNDSFLERVDSKIACSTRQSNFKLNLSRIELICDSDNHEDEEEEDDGCLAYCNVFRRINGDPALSLRVKQLLLSLSETSPKALLPESPFTLLPECLWPGEHSVDKDCFAPTLTDRGKCMVMGSDAIARAFAQRPGGHKANSGGNEISSTTVKVLVDFGKELGMSNGIGSPHLNALLLDVFISNRFQAMRPREKLMWSLHMKPKDVYRIAVTTEAKIEASKSFRDMSIARRQCLFADEKDLEHFTVYSRQNCILECRWREALSQCGCAPWYMSALYPQSQICELSGLQCFKEVLKASLFSSGNFSHSDRCVAANCMPDCEGTKYDANIALLENPMKCGHQYAFNAKISEEDAPYCRFLDSKNLSHVLEDELKVITWKEWVIRYFFVGLGSQVNTFFSSPHLTSPAIGALVIEFDRETTTVIRKTAAATPFDLLASAGGTLGLFCGISIMSAIEVVFWAWKGLTQLLARIPIQKGGKRTR